MRGYEVIFKFLMISFKTPLESRFSWDPLHYFPYSSSPTLWILYIFGIYGKVFQAASGRGSFMAHGSFSTKHVGIYQNTASNTYYQYPCFPPDITHIWTSPPSSLQVLQQFLIDSGSIGSDFGAEFSGLLVGF